MRSHRRLCWLVVDCVHPGAAADDDRKQTARMSRQSAENHTADTTVRLVPRTETTFLIFAPTICTYLLQLYEIQVSSSSRRNTRCRQTTIGFIRFQPLAHYVWGGVGLINIWGIYRARKWVWEGESPLCRRA